MYACIHTIFIHACAHTHTDIYARESASTRALTHSHTQQDGDEESADDSGRPATGQHGAPPFPAENNVRGSGSGRRGGGGGGGSSSEGVRVWGSVDGVVDPGLLAAKGALPEARPRLTLEGEPRAQLHVYDDHLKTLKYLAVWQNDPSKVASEVQTYIYRYMWVCMNIYRYNTSYLTCPRWRRQCRRISTDICGYV